MGDGGVGYPNLAAQKTIVMRTSGKLKCIFKITSLMLIAFTIPIFHIKSRTYIYLYNSYSLEQTLAVMPILGMPSII